MDVAAGEAADATELIDVGAAVAAGDGEEEEEGERDREKTLAVEDQKSEAAVEEEGPWLPEAAKDDDGPTWAVFVGCETAV